MFDSYRGNIRKTHKLNKVFKYLSWPRNLSWFLLCEYICCIKNISESELLLCPAPCFGAFVTYLDGTRLRFE